MGTSASTANNFTYQKSLNQLFQNEESDCIATCSSDIDGVTIKITDSSVGGDINIEASCTAQAACTMANSLQATTFTQLDAVQTASAEAPIGKIWTWPGLSIAVTNNYTNQSLTNNIAQIITSTCYADSDTVVKDITIDIENSNVDGGINISAIGDANVACQMSNSATIQTTSAASASQTATSSTGKSLTKLSAVMLALLLLFGFFIFYEYIRYKGKKAELETKSEIELSALEKKSEVDLEYLKLENRKLDIQSKGTPTVVSGVSVPGQTVSTQAVPLST